MNSRPDFLIPIFFMMSSFLTALGDRTIADVMFSEFLLPFFFSFFNAQRFGIKWWFTQALRCISNHLHPTWAKTVVICCLSFPFGLVLSTTSRAVPAPGRRELLAADAGTWGTLITVCSDRQPSRSCHSASDGTFFTSGPSLTRPQTSPQREEFCPAVCQHPEYLPITWMALSEAVPLH